MGMLFENKVSMSGHNEGKHKELKIIHKNEYNYSQEHTHLHPYTND